MNLDSTMGSPPTLQRLSLPLCCLLPLLLEEPLPELLPLPASPALTVGVLTQQAREHHLGVAWVCVPTAVRVTQVIVALALRLLVLMPVVNDSLFHRTILLHFSAVKEASYFAIMEHFSICMEDTGQRHYSRVSSDIYLFTMMSAAQIIEYGIFLVS